MAVVIANVPDSVLTSLTVWRRGTAAIPSVHQTYKQRRVKTPSYLHRFTCHDWRTGGFVRGNSSSWRPSAVTLSETFYTGADPQRRNFHITASFLVWKVGVRYKYSPTWKSEGVRTYAYLQKLRLFMGGRGNRRRKEWLTAIMITTRCINGAVIQRWKWVIFRDPRPAHVIHHTVDPWPTWPMTHDPWPLHYFILLMGLGGGVAWWYWTTLSVLKAKNIVD